MLQELNKDNLIDNLSPREQAGFLLKEGIDLSNLNNLEPIATTSGGKYSATLMGLLVEHKIDIPVIFVDMGPACYTKDTYEMIEKFHKIGIDIHRYFSHLSSSSRPPTLVELNKRFGPNWRNPADSEYENVIRELKEIPYQNALAELIKEKGKNGFSLFRGTRIDSDISNRSTIPSFEWHQPNLVVHPVARWSDDETIRYLLERGLDINKNHTDPSRARKQENGNLVIIYPDSTKFSADHTVCLLDRESEKKN